MLYLPVRSVHHLYTVIRNTRMRNLTVHLVKLISLSFLVYIYFKFIGVKTVLRKTFHKYIKYKVIKE